MHCSRIFGAALFASVAIVAAPADVMSQSTTEKIERQAKSVARDAKAGITDSWLTGKTKIALFADERVKGRQVSVETVKGAVTLRGKVDSAEAKGAAESVAKAVDGVKSVRNDLQVVPPGDRQVIDVSDEEITRRVAGQLSEDGGLKKVDARTDGGVVTLTGRVASIDASARASELARDVPGVRAVKNELTEGASRLTAGSHAQVMAIQHALQDKGFDPGPADGIMGRRTEAALAEYQKSEHLTMTGKLDRDTAAKLGVREVSAEKR